MGQVALATDTHRVGRVIPRGFLGLGFEYGKLQRYAGDDPQAVDPVLEQLIRNLTPGQSPVVRIGGDTTDWSWWPVPGMQPPPGVSYTLTPAWIAVLQALTRSLDAHLIMGINFEADSNIIAATEAHALIGGIGGDSIQALELGNEPELYSTFGWYQTPNGTEVSGRPTNWDFPMFEQNFMSVASALPPVALAGPTTGQPWWDPELGRFLTDNPRVSIATVHRYPLWICVPTSPLYPSVAHLLSATASAGLAASVSNLVRVAHDHKIPLRVDEMNITPCPVRAMRLRPSFATSLWALDVLFEMASVGVDGVNLQTSTGGMDDLFTFQQIDGRWEAAVAPEYYGLLTFARATPGGSRLVPLLHTPRPPLHAWATRAPDGTVRIVVINEGRRPKTIDVNGPVVRAPATLDRLLAATSAHAHQVTLGGQTFGTWTRTGALAGREARLVVKPHGQEYVFNVPGWSADLLTIRR
jgi:hypothetical protein